jgi:DNA-binding response OmpR family regulator
MAKQIILVIEDDEAIRRGIVDALSFDGYKTLEAAEGKAGMASALQSPCDLILLDLVLPKIGGLAILEEVRKSRPTLPVIVLTARGEESDRIKGLRLGADDYVVKPFSIKELLARVQAVLRRTPGRPSDLSSIDFPGGRFDLKRCELHFDDGRRGELSERETELLRYLAMNFERAVSRDEIMERIWHINPRCVVETRTIDMHIARLREKLRDDSDHPRIILTVRGKGYRFAGKETALSKSVGRSGSFSD